jgi:hypothetical protein
MIPSGTHWVQESAGTTLPDGTPITVSVERLRFDRGFHLAAVKKWGTESRTTELHFLAAKGDYKSFSVHSFAGLHQTDDTWAFGSLGADLEQRKYTFLMMKRCTRLFGYRLALHCMRLTIPGGRQLSKLHLTN